MTDHWFAADQRDVHRFILAYQFEDAVNERVAAEIVQLGEEFTSAKVGIAVGITAGTTERAFARDFNGQHRRFAAQDFPPGAHNFSRRNAWIWLSSSHGRWILENRSLAACSL